MLSDFEREMCRNYKRRLDMAKTPEGLLALKLANQKQQESAKREKILKQYVEQQSAAFPKLEREESEIERILKFY